MRGEWYDDRLNLAQLARYMEQQDDSTCDDVVYMLEKPWKFEEEWRRCDDASSRPTQDDRLKAEADRASVRLARVPPHARARRRTSEHE